MESISDKKAYAGKCSPELIADYLESFADEQFPTGQEIGAEIQQAIYLLMAERDPVDEVMHDAELAGYLENVDWKTVYSAAPYKALGQDGIVHTHGKSSTKIGRRRYEG